jgi:hypothetical protein
MAQVPVLTTAALARIPELPAYVKSASYLDSGARADLPARAFADRGRRYPCHDRANTYVSMVEYHAAGGGDPGVEARLSKAASIFGIELDVADIPNHVGPVVEKRAATAADYALSGDFGGETLNLFPMATADELIKSAGQLEGTRDKTTYPMRREAARNMLKRAAELNLTLGDFVSKAAGMGPATVGEIRRGLAARAVVAPSHHRELYQKIAAVLPEDDNAILPDLDKTAELIDLADRISGLHRKLDRGLESVEELLYAGDRPTELTMKVASGRKPVREVRDSGLTLDELAPLGDAFVEAVRTPFQMFDKSAGIDWAKLAVAAENLDWGDSRILARILRQRAAAV